MKTIELNLFSKEQKEEQDHFLKEIKEALQELYNDSTDKFNFVLEFDLLEIIKDYSLLTISHIYQLLLLLQMRKEIILLYFDTKNYRKAFITVVENEELKEYINNQYSLL